MKKIVKILLVSLIIATFMTSFSNAALPKVQLKWGVATLGSSAQMVSTAVASVVSKYNPNIAISIQATAGSAENVRLIRRGEIDIANASEAYSAIFSKGTFAGEPATELWGLFCLYENQFVITVKNDGKITKTTDLVGKKVCMGPAGSGSYQAGYAMLEALGLVEKVKIINLSYTAANDAMKDGSVDAVITFMSAGIPIPAFEQLMQSMSLYVIPTKASDYDFAFKKNPDYGPSGILKAGSIAPIKADMSTFCNFTIQYADSRMSDEVAYELCKALYEHANELGSYHQIAGTMSANNALNGFNPEVPIHPGAAKYYKEKGVWRDTLKVAVRK